MMYKIKPEFIDLWGEDASEETVISESELETIARGWETPKKELLPQLIQVSVVKAVEDMKAKISRTEIMARRGLLTPREAELRITQLIDEGLVEDVFMGEKEHGKLMRERRLADRRKWRFLLSLTKGSAEY